MPRTARVIAVNEAHHVYQRSAGNRVLFPTEKDHRQYLETLRDACRRFRVEVLAYCLLKKSVHLVVKPKTRRGLAQAVGRTHLNYSRYLNARRNSDALVWRNRFQSCAVENRRLLTIVQFVESQPVYEKLVRQAGKYDWSSAMAHSKGKDEFDVLARTWPVARQRKTWAQMLRKSIDVETRKEIQVTTQTGRPWGSDGFIAKLEKKYRRRLKALPVGRPRLED